MSRTGKSRRVFKNLPLTAVLTGAVGVDALVAATEDRLHQPYRAAGTPATADLVQQLRGQGFAAVVSGAGPTVLVLARAEVEVEQISAATPQGWRCHRLTVDARGARTVPVTGL